MRRRSIVAIALLIAGSVGLSAVAQGAKAEAQSAKAGTMAEAQSAKVEASAPLELTRLRAPITVDGAMSDEGWLR